MVWDESCGWVLHRRRGLTALSERVSESAESAGQQVSRSAGQEGQAGGNDRGDEEPGSEREEYVAKKYGKPRSAPRRPVKSVRLAEAGDCARLEEMVLAEVGGRARLVLGVRAWAYAWLSGTRFRPTHRVEKRPYAMAFERLTAWYRWWGPTRERRMRAARVMSLLAEDESNVVRCSAVEGMGTMACTSVAAG